MRTKLKNILVIGGVAVAAYKTGEIVAYIKSLKTIIDVYIEHRNQYPEYYNYYNRHSKSSSRVD